MAIRKRFLKTRPECKVTFTIPESIGNGAKTAHVVGDFNDWSTSVTPMKRLKTGALNATVDLETGRSYQFRYLFGQSHWGNDPDADDHVPSPFGDSSNSVIHI